MKIAILTQPLHINYGGLLQAFALQKVLRDMGHEPITLTIERKQCTISMYVQFRNFVASIAHFFLGHVKWMDIYWPYNTRDRNRRIMIKRMRPFVEEYIETSPALYSTDEIQKYVHQQGFNAYIVGSDQVWRPMYSNCIEWFFLSFLPPNSSVKRISYAASFGTSEWEFTKEQMSRCVPLAKKFNAISVREKTGVDLCEKYFEKEAVHVLDPTMLLSSPVYQSIVDVSSDTKCLKNKIFAYVLDANRNSSNALSLISKTLKFDIEASTACPVLGPYASKKKAVNETPTAIAQWLRAFEECKCVVTDSFHGTVFSILHHRPFIVLKNEDRGVSRIETLLSVFDLKDRLFQSNSILRDREWILNGIDWNKVDAILNEKRKQSFEFLQNAINQ